MSVGEPALDKFMDLIFIFSALGVIAAATMVISSNSPVHSVFWLVIAFILSVILFVSLSLDYIAFLFFIVYVGAIAILFLFVVMMLYSATETTPLRMYEYLPLSFTVGTVALLKVLDTISEGLISYGLIHKNYWGATYKPCNIESIAETLYTDYALLFVVTSILLLAALIGAIVLTHTSSINIKRQIAFKQIIRQSN